MTKVFEVAPMDFGILWVAAESRGEVEAAVEGTEAKVQDELEGPEYPNWIVDFRLPEEKEELRKRLEW